MDTSRPPSFMGPLLSLLSSGPEVVCVGLPILLSGPPRSLSTLIFLGAHFPGLEFPPALRLASALHPWHRRQLNLQVIASALRGFLHSLTAAGPAGLQWPDWAGGALSRKQGFFQCKGASGGGFPSPASANAGQSSRTWPHPSGSSRPIS